MGRHLIVAHQTSASPELVERLMAVAKGDSLAEFVLLVPATPPEHLLTWTEGESTQVARRTAEAARTRLESAGLRVVRTAIGDASPVLAVTDEMREHSEEYDGIVVCTFPLGMSRWLGLDLHGQLQKRFRLPLIHAVAQPEGPERH